MIFHDRVNPVDTHIGLDNISKKLAVGSGKYNNKEVGKESNA